GEPLVRRAVNRTMGHPIGRRILAEEIPAPPVSRRPDGPLGESAAAIRTHVSEHALHAVRAERALVRTNARFGGARWERSVAVLAGRTELQHDVMERRRRNVSAPPSFQLVTSDFLLLPPRLPLRGFLRFLGGLRLLLGGLLGSLLSGLFRGL